MKKIYTIRINDKVPENIWYGAKQGRTYETQLAIAEGSRGGSMQPVFKLSGPPFFHVYPQHCTVINEKTI